MTRDRHLAADIFFSRVSDAAALAHLFDHLPRVYLFVKDDEHRFVKVNRSWLALHGCGDESAVVGKSDFDFHPPALAAQYVEEDKRVMESGQVLADRAWLVLGADGTPRWYLSTKIPLSDARGHVIGLAGFLRPHDHTESASTADAASDVPGEYRRLTPACEHVLAHYGEAITVADLADKANLSVSQLQREFRRLFGMSPTDYLLRCRLLVARRQLEQTALAVGRIAMSCGFYDQSHFTRSFHAETGLTPLDYRRRFGAASPQK